ncbi:MAG: ATP-binding protein [Terriglobia bacterium]
MTNVPEQSWEDFNRAYLMGALDDLREALRRHHAPEPRETGETEVAGEAETGEDAYPAEVRTAGDGGRSEDAPPALETICAIFGLSSFERRILLMCAAVELDSRFAPIYEAANKGQRPALPTFSLALAAFDDAHWSAMLPGRPLRHWHLIEVLSGDALTTSPLRIEERILHYLTGMRSMDERVRGVVDGVGPARTLTPSELTVAQRIVDCLSPRSRQESRPVVQLCGSEPASRRAVAAQACALLGLSLHIMNAQAIPRGVAEIELFTRLWERETVLQPNCLLLEFDDGPALDAASEFAVKRLIEKLRSPLVISNREQIKPVERKLLSFDVPPATAKEQIELWYRALGAVAPVLNGEVAAIVSQFSMSADRIEAAVAQMPRELWPEGLKSLSPEAASEAAPVLAQALWDACRLQARPRLEGLAQRIEPAAAWDDLVLPEKQKQLLSQIAVHVRHRAKVYRRWGFASKISRGLGISALFAGPSGTGKTMAGEVLANQLRLDLYRIDLSQVISKYIGETEKNLHRVFDAAEESAAILLFDEADALFGKRSEVKDSHDRYANIEVSYLLQRMEAYRGLAILTTNRRDALDTAFLRRIRFVVEFPFPEAPQRAEIWARAFPSQTPTEGLRIERLARLSAAGGNIQNIAMGAAFLAADAGEPVRMSHLLSAARSEFTKIERPLADAEIAGWV